MSNLKYCTKLGLRFFNVLFVTGCGRVLVACHLSLKSCVLVLLLHSSPWAMSTMVNVAPHHLNFLFVRHLQGIVKFAFVAHATIHHNRTVVAFFHGKGSSRTILLVAMYMFFQVSICIFAHVLCSDWCTIRFGLVCVVVVECL